MSLVISKIKQNIYYPKNYIQSKSYTQVDRAKKIISVAGSTLGVAAGVSLVKNRGVSVLGSSSLIRSQFKKFVGLVSSSFNNKAFKGDSE